MERERASSPGGRGSKPEVASERPPIEETEAVVDLFPFGEMEAVITGGAMGGRVELDVGPRGEDCGGWSGTSGAGDPALLRPEKAR